MNAASAIANPAPRARSPEPFPERPCFILARRDVAWDELAPNLEGTYGRSGGEVLDTFPIPGNVDGTDLDRVSWDSRSIRFAEAGEYYLHTSIGCFKILILPDTDDARVLAIARFVARNSVHCQADARKIQPLFRDYSLTPDALLGTLFASDQPLKLHCGYLAMFLGHLFTRCGYRARLVQLLTGDEPPVGHIALEAYLPAANTFALIDPDFGAVVRDRQAGDLVSVATAAKFLRDEPDRLQVEDIGNKEWLKPKYNVDEPTPDFAWTPRAMSGRGTTRFWPSLAPGDYKEILTLYTASYSIFDDPLGQGPPRRFARDGSPHHSQ